METKVYVLDDDPAVRQGVCRLLQSAQIDALPCVTVGEFLASYHPAEAGCLVLDVRMPEVSGLELQTKLQSDNIFLPIVFITGYGDVPMAVKAIKNGAIDFLQKPFRDEDLLDAVRRAIQLNREQKKLHKEKAYIREKFSQLSNREHEIMTMVVSGQSNKNIANALSITEKTVEFHRAHLMRKLQAENLPALVRMALRAQEILG